MERLGKDDDGGMEDALEKHHSVALTRTEADKILNGFDTTDCIQFKAFARLQQKHPVPSFLFFHSRDSYLSHTALHASSTLHGLFS